MNKSTLFFLLLSLGIFFNIQAIAQKKSLEDETNIIPAGFGKDKSTLLVVKTMGPPGFNGMLEKAFEKYYKGPFEVIKFKEQTESQYHDTAKYRYKFDVDIKTKSGSFTTRRSDGTLDRQGPTYEYSFSIIDTKSGESFQTSYYEAKIKNVIESYVKMLEAERLKNQ